MAATGYTPISLYYSTTGSAVPVNTNLVNGELAINITDGKLYYKDNGGTVQLIASKAGASGDVTLAGNNAFTGANTFYNNTGQTFGTATTAQDGIILSGRAGGTSTYRVTIVPTTLTASRTVTLPDANTTIPIASQPITLSGPSAARTYTFPDANATVLTTNAAVTVSQGGTGLTSATAYAVLCGGTTSTGAFQSVASVGTAGQVLTSNGAGALPTFQTPSSGGAVGSTLYLNNVYGGF